MKKKLFACFLVLLGSIFGYYLHPVINSTNKEKVSQDNSLNSNKIVELKEPIEAIETTAPQPSNIKTSETISKDIKASIISTDSDSPDNNNLDSSTGKLMDIILSRDKLSPELDKIATQRLKDLKNNQPDELNDLFPEIEQIAELTDQSYKKHLSEEKDINWAYQAESFLENYFQNNSASNFRVLRIDCRTTNCEVAGMLTLPDNLVNIDLINPVNSLELLQVSTKVSTDIIQSNGASYLFTYSAKFTSPNILTESRNPIPYAFFLGRAQNN